MEEMTKPPQGKVRPKRSVTNKYHITCWRCFCLVFPGEGFVFREGLQPGWIGEHNECPETGEGVTFSDFFDDPKFGR